MPCKAGTFNVFPMKSPPLLLQCPSLSPRIQQAAAGVGCARIPQLPTPSGSQGTPHTGRKRKEGYWKGLTNSPQRVQGVTNYFFTVTPSAVHQVQVASGQRSSLTLLGPRRWQTLEPGPQKGCEAQGLCPRNQPRTDCACSPTPPNWKEMSSSLHAVWQLHQRRFAQIIKAPQHRVQSLTRAMPNYHKSLLI